MSWDQMEKAVEESGSELFVKLKDGEEIIGVFRGEPYCFRQIFKDQTEYPVDAFLKGASFKFKIAFITKDEGKYVAKIFQGSKRVSETLLDAKNEYGLDCTFKVKRTGSGKDDTRYSILFKAKLSPAELKEINSIELPSLQRPEEGTEEERHAKNAQLAKEANRQVQASKVFQENAPKDESWMSEDVPF